MEGFQDWKLHGNHLILFTVDAVQNGEPAGKLYHRYQKEPTPYLGISSFLQICSELFDTIGTPARGTILRTFGVEEPPKPFAPVPPPSISMAELLHQSDKGQLGTFLLLVQHREHSTWQGELRWLEQRISREFCSVLELLKLLDSALGISSSL